MRSRSPYVPSRSPMSSESEEFDVPSDAALLYDPLSDDRDAQWVGKMRKGRSSDAILSCPCCFVTLCVDCQHHDSQQNRYRAMFVMNCKVTHLTHLCRHISLHPQVMTNEKESLCRSNAARGRMAESEGCIVKCEKCECEVGFYDADEVYHFFNVLPSTA